MLQVPCFSPPVYGTSHYKKFWLRQTQVKDDIGLDMKSSITTGSPQRRVCTRRRMMRSALHSPPKAPDADQKSYLDAKGVSAVVEIKPQNGFLKSEAEDEDQKVKKCESGSDTDTTDCTVSSNLESIGGAETPPRLSRSGSPLRRPPIDLTAHEILREEDEENELEDEEDEEEDHDMGNEELKKRHHLSEDCLTSAYRVDDLECREDADHFSDDSESEKPVPATGSARDADSKAHEEQEEEEEEEDDDVGGEDLDQENENLRGDSLDSCSTDCGYVSEKNSARRSYLPSSSKAAKWKDESAKISNAVSPKRRHLTDGPAKASHAINSSAMANNSHNISRTCKHCGTMKTPLWRNGPLGPKSLCNACGIRLRKARRMSASNNQDTQVTTSSPAKRKQDQDVGMDGSHHTYKRSRMSFIREKKEGNFGRSASFGHRSSSSKVLSSKLSTPLSTYNSRIGKSPALRRSFSKDEEEGAVLLMALSCGLVLA